MKNKQNLNSESFLLIYNDKRNKFFSNEFDIISGNGEVKDTKALGITFYKDRKFLNSFLKKADVSEIPENQKYYIYIEPYLGKNQKSRIDILIIFSKNNNEKTAIIIEAKNKNLKITDPKNKKTEEQLNEYKKNVNDFFSIDNIELIKLTKNKVLNESKIKSITWNDIINLCNIENEITKTLKNFLTKENKKMNYYEEEVLSMPAGKSFKCIEEHGIYSCPNTKNYNFKKCLYLTFRNTNGGEMNNLYKIENEFTMDPNDIENNYKYIEEKLGSNQADRLKNYLNDKEHKGTNDIKIFIFNKDEKIPLKHSPKPKKRNNTGKSYYSLFDILTKNELIPTSQK